MDKFTLLTEEQPNIDEIKLILSFIDKKIPDSISNYDIIPTIITNTEGKKKFNNMWTLKVNDLIINIELFKGKTSSVDCQ